MKTALITGITGQDGSYLAELLLSKDYKVVGLVSQKYNIGYENIESIKDAILLEDGDLLDQQSLNQAFEKHKPDEIYNLAGVTFVPTSWEKPTLTFDINTLGVSRVLELIINKYPSTKFFQASSSRMFGTAATSPQDEQTPFSPQDPYSVSKVAAHQLGVLLRKKHQIFVSHGIMFNHESERRGVEFVTRKITQTAAKIKKGIENELVLGDLDAKQDWGYAPDYVQAMWLMLQQEQPDDFVIASGTFHTVRDICHVAFGHLEMDFQNYVKIDPSFVRPPQEFVPLGQATKASQMLGWQPQVTFDEMIIRMVEHDLTLLM